VANPPIRKYLFADEAGNFDFTRKQGASRYFILTAVTVQDCSPVNAKLHELRHQMAWEGHDHPGPFHASSDPRPVRERVFSIIEGLDLRVDAMILEKAKASPSMRSSETRFYQHAWYYLMHYTVPRLLCDELLVIPASLGEKKKRLAFYDTVREVMRHVRRMTCRTACWEASADACLQVADYCGWAIQRRWEYQDPSSWERIADKVESEYNLFAKKEAGEEE
jgi:hypothetical protein